MKGREHRTDYSISVAWGMQTKRGMRDIKQLTRHYSDIDNDESMKLLLVPRYQRLHIFPITREQRGLQTLSS